jgi:hypothetical protein
MKRYLFGALCGVVAVCVVPAFAQRSSDDSIKQRMIEESLTGYRGSCPCPYFLASNGSKCGARSAYSKRGGKGLLCYPEDISQEMVDAYRAKTNRSR